MRRLGAALLITLGVVGPTFTVWWVLASGYMEEHPVFGPRAFAGPIILGLMCVLFGVAFWGDPPKRG
jgi:hypothetical protein